MATCQELADRLRTLQSLILHVVDPGAKAHLAALMGEIEAEQNRIGCLNTFHRLLEGTVVLCADKFITGLKTRPISIIFSIIASTGEATFVFAPVLFGSITLSLQPNSVGTAQFNQNTGILTAHAPLLLHGVPTGGDISTDIFFGTPNSFLTPCGKFEGHPLDAAGNIALTGTTLISVNVFIISVDVNAWLKVEGTLGPATTT